MRPRIGYIAVSPITVDPAVAFGRKSNTIVIHTDEEIVLARKACQLAADTLVMIEEHIRPGVSTGELDRLCHEYIEAHGAYPSPLGYRGFPKATCTSVNQVVCHGIPSFEHTLCDGDIINVDITAKLSGFHGDTSKTFFVGTPSAQARHLVETTRRCLELGIAAVKPGARIGDIGAAIQLHAEANGCSVVRDFVGHGVGRVFHCAPEVPHFGRAGRGARLYKGMIFTIEPMINQGDWRTTILEDDWTAVTSDGKLSAQFEHTILVTTDGVDILTLPSAAPKV